MSLKGSLYLIHLVRMSISIIDVGKEGSPVHVLVKIVYYIYSNNLAKKKKKELNDRSIEK